MGKLEGVPGLDWLLLYRVDGEELQLARTGTHADLFQEYVQFLCANSGFNPNANHASETTKARGRNHRAFGDLVKLVPVHEQTIMQDQSSPASAATGRQLAGRYLASKSALAQVQVN